MDIKQSEYQVKRENLKEVYKNLIEIVKLYPDESLNSVLMFIAGQHAGDSGDPINNKIIVARENLIHSMRNDIGIW